MEIYVYIFKFIHMIKEEDFKSKLCKVGQQAGDPEKRQCCSSSKGPSD